MPIEVNAGSILCTRCGKAYPVRRGNFSVSYGAVYKGVQTLHICKECMTEMYKAYLAKADEPKQAVRQMCRKLDLYWSEDVFNTVEKLNTTRNLFHSYLTKINTVKYAGRCYDDSLEEEGSLWSFGKCGNRVEEEPEQVSKNEADEQSEESVEIPKDWELFWGSGYSYDTYERLEELLEYNLNEWKVERDDLEFGTRLLIVQLCTAQLDIAKKRAAGQFPKDEIAAVQSIMAGLNLKPAQKKAEDGDSKINNTPLGVWARRLEFERPIPEPDPEFKDTDGIIKYITTWFFGHAAKMLGKKNIYSKLYDEAMKDYRIQKPELDDEDDEEFFEDIFPYTREDEGEKGDEEV